MTTTSVDATNQHLAGRELRRQPLKAVARRAPAFVQSGSSIGAAISVMQAHAGDSLLVCVGERLLGVITERDIVHRVLARGIDLGTEVDVFMTREPDTLTPDSTLVEALELMERHGYRSVPLVTADGHIEGLVRQTDILAFVAEAFPQEILNLPPNPEQVATTAEGG
jgi:CBS domain-containing protein